MKPKTFTGWLAKDELEVLGRKDKDCRTIMASLWKTKGQMDDWFHGSWPPAKVRITVEVLK